MFNLGLDLPQNPILTGQTKTRHIPDFREVHPFPMAYKKSKSPRRCFFARTFEAVCQFVDDIEAKNDETLNNYSASEFEELGNSYHPQAGSYVRKSMPRF